jgi:hypothetical protein
LAASALDGFPYPLPVFAARVLDAQPRPPRAVPLLSTAEAVLTGIDCLIYSGTGLLFTVLGTVAASSTRGIGLVFLAAGLAELGLVVFRVWQVQLALVSGDALAAQVEQSSAGPPRVYGSLWGEPLTSRSRSPYASRGVYRIADTGETGGYYVQQRWAVALKPGDAIWVLRRRGRDVLYAPANA